MARRDSIQTLVDEAFTKLILLTLQLIVTADNVEDLNDPRGYLESRATDGHFAHVPTAMLDVRTRFERLLNVVAQTTSTRPANDIAGPDGDERQRRRKALSTAMGIVLADAPAAYMRRDAAALKQALSGFPPDEVDEGALDFGDVRRAFRRRVSTYGVNAPVRRQISEMLDRLERAWLQPELPFISNYRAAA